MTHTILGLHLKSIRHAAREVALCQFTAQAMLIVRQDAKTAAEVHLANQSLGEATRQLRAAKNKLNFEIRQLQ
jgi:hypothetical protein